MSPVTPTNNVLGFTPIPELEGPPQCEQQQGLSSVVNNGWYNKCCQPRMVQQVSFKNSFVIDFTGQNLFKECLLNLNPDN